MNRSLIVVKNPNKREFYSIRLHWDYGESVENWLKNTYKDYNSIAGLIEKGHRSTIEESHGIEKWWTHKTLRAAVKNCEHYTLAYFNGKWKFTHFS
jgi:hypothetical protein